MGKEGGWRGTDGRKGLRLQEKRGGCNAAHAMENGRWKMEEGGEKFE
jgi:hypothetical protein